MGDQQYDELYKVVLVGDPAVGKTNLLATFLALDESKPDVGTRTDGVSKGFSAVRKPTIGVEFGTKIVHHPNGKRIKAQIWDTAGQERYRAITSSHYRRAAGALVVYDVTNRASFDNARGHWYTELKAQADPSSTLATCIVLVGNKCDLETLPSNTSGVSSAEHDEAAAQLKLMGERTSAKTALNVQRAFDDLVISIYDEDKGKLQRMTTIRTLTLEEPKSKSSPAAQRAKQCCNA